MKMNETKPWNDSATCTKDAQRIAYVTIFKQLVETKKKTFQFGYAAIRSLGRGLAPAPHMSVLMFLGPDAVGAVHKFKTKCIFLLSIQLPDRIK